MRVVLAPELARVQEPALMQEVVLELPSLLYRTLIVQV